MIDRPKYFVYVDGVLDSTFYYWPDAIREQAKYFGTDKTVEVIEK